MSDHDRDVAAVLTEALAQLDAEHYADPELKGRGGCVMCWPKDGSWPCTTRMIADDLRRVVGTQGKALPGDTEADARERYRRGGFGRGAAALERLNRYLAWMERTDA